MLQKPEYLAPQYGAQFKDLSIVEAYRHRPSYPAETFAILSELIHDEPRHVLDVGCGTGCIARYLVEHVERLDAVDFSLHMIEQGKQLPNGDHPRLHWLQGAIEDVTLNPPYAQITAGECLHWMDWNVVLPRFRELLLPGGYLAIVERRTLPVSWFSALGEIISRYSTNQDFYQGFDMIETLEQHGLFQKVGEKETASIPFTQSIDDYIESYHSRNGFSRQRMDPAMAEAFDREAKEILLKSHPDGVISLQVFSSIVWGIPQVLSVH